MTALLALIPGFLSIMQWWFKAKADVELAKISARASVGSSAMNAAAQEAEGRARTWGIIGANQLLVLLILFLAAPIGIYEWKEIVVDKVIGPGCIPLTSWCWIAITDPIRDTTVAGWMTTIIGSLFGSSTVLAVAQLWWTTKD